MVRFASLIAITVFTFLKHSDGLIAINKPFGVPLMKTGLTTGHSESLFSIEEALIPLASKLNIEKLLPAKLVERFSSGISLFSCQEKVVDKIQQCYISNKREKIHTFKYLAVTIGEPKPSASKGTVGMGLFEHKDLTRKLVLPWLLHTNSLFDPNSFFFDSQSS